MKLSDIIPDADGVVALDPDELGLRMLPFLAALPHLYVNIPLDLTHLIKGRDRLGQYPLDRYPEIEVALREAWAWLEGQALLIQSPDGNNTRVLSRLARKLAKDPDPRRALSTRRFPKDSLHSKLQEDVWALYHRGKYDTAVFEAMKSVEIAVREAAALAPKDIGTDLMRKAFDPDNGPLADMSTEKAEREARAHLFAGAIGSYKNPHSHRNVALDDPDEAAEIVMLANHLLRIVDTRRKAKQIT